VDQGRQTCRDAKEAIEDGGPVAQPGQDTELEIHVDCHAERKRGIAQGSFPDQRVYQKSFTLCQMTNWQMSQDPSEIRQSISSH